MYVAVGMIGAAAIGGVASYASSKKSSGGGGGGGYDAMSMARLGLMANTRPQYIDAPAPAGYTYYGNDGTYSEMTWNAGANRYEYRARQLTAAEQAEKAKLEKMRGDVIDNLDATPEAMTKAWEKYTGAYKGKMSDALDTAYSEAAGKILGDAEARGWSPSAAMGKLGSENIKDRLNVERDAIMTGYDLENTYRNNNQNLLQMLYGFKQADDQSALNWANSAANITSNARQQQLAENAAKNNYNMDAWKSFWNLESGQQAQANDLQMQQNLINAQQRNATMQGIGNLLGTGTMALAKYYGGSTTPTPTSPSLAYSYSSPLTAKINTPTVFTGLRSVGGWGK